MSRVSKNPIRIPSGVEVDISNVSVVVTGPKGKLEQSITENLKLVKEEDNIKVETTVEDKHANAMSGTLRSLVANMIHGVSVGFEKKLLLVGVGYRAQSAGSDLNLNLGYSHPINYAVPAGITVELPTQTEIIIKGIDKQRVGQTAAEIRSFRRPEPYKGKGVRYADETIKLKEAKKK